MDRRQFLTSAAAGSLALAGWPVRADEADRDAPSPRRRTPASRRPRSWPTSSASTPGTGVKKPDYLATIDLDPASKTYSQVIHRLPMPNVGDELHHFGWNACASCHGERARRYLIVPGLRLGPHPHRRYGRPPSSPKLHKVIEPEEVVRKTKLTAPHTVHCLADGRIMISMLGDDKLQRPGRVPAARREVRDRRPLGGETRGDELQLRLLVSAPAQRDGQQRVGRPEHDAARASSSTT